MAWNLVFFNRKLIIVENLYWERNGEYEDIYLYWHMFVYIDACAHLFAYAQTPESEEHNLFAATFQRDHFGICIGHATMVYESRHTSFLGGVHYVLRTCREKKRERKRTNLNKQSIFSLVS
jgi:hypothetical protein